MPWWILHPLNGTGYQFWSGIGSGSPVMAGVLLLYRKHVCHERWCPFITFKPHPDDPDHQVCRMHHRKARWSARPRQEVFKGAGGAVSCSALPPPR